MTPEEQLQVDLQEMEQVCLHPGWKVVERRVQGAIDSFNEALLLAPLPEVERIRQRILAYKELLELPKTILDQFKEKAAQDSPE